MELLNSTIFLKKAIHYYMANRNEQETRLENRIVLDQVQYIDTGKRQEWRATIHAQPCIFQQDVDTIYLVSAVGELAKLTRRKSLRTTTEGESIMQTDWLNIIFTIVQIAGGLWTLVFGGKAIMEVVQQRGQNQKQLGPKKPSFKLKPLTVANILLGLLVILVGTIAVKLSLQPQSTVVSTPTAIPTTLSTVTVSVTPTTSTSPPGPLVRTLGVNGAYSLLHLFCDDIGSGQYQQAYNLMTETEQSFVGLSELKHWVKCTPPSSTSEINMLSQIQGSCVIQMFGTEDTVVRKITLSYTDQDGWKISDYRS